MAWKKLLVSFAFMFLCAGCEVMGVFAEKADRVIANVAPDPEPRIKFSWAVAVDSCTQSPTPDTTLSDPVCVSLLTRGRELECIASRISQEGVRNRYAAPNGLLNWEICVKDVARVLTDGYYLGNREIERRLQLCEGLLEAAATQPVKGVFSRLLGQTPPAAPARPAPSESGLGGHGTPTGLLKCEVLLPPKSIPVEVKPVVSNPVVEAPPEQSKATPTVKPAKKKRNKKAQTNPAGKDEPAVKKPARSAGGDKPGAKSGDASENLKSPGKQT